MNTSTLSARTGEKKTRPIAIEVCCTAFRWCGERGRIYAHAWRTTMAAMSVYEGMMRQPGGGRVQTDAARKALGEITRNY